MNLSLVVAHGVHEGKVIPITTAQFLIGRDPHCQLRPASASISKQHCGLFVRDNKVFLRDYGSTNGTFVNGEQIAGEREVVNNDRLKVGPLEFLLRVEHSSPVLKTPVAAKSPAAVATPQPAQQNGEQQQDPDALAAMLLGMDDGESASSSDATAEAVIPDGTTVMDIPAVPGQGPAKKEEKKPPSPDTASAAASILSKYMRRPRT